MSKKIVILSGNYFGQVSGGAEYQQFLLASHLKKLGHRVWYAFVDNKSPIKYDREFELIPIRKRSLLRRILGRPFFLDYFKLSRQLERIAPNVIIVRGGFAYVGIAARYCAHHQCMLVWQISSQKDIEPFRPKLTRSILFDYIDKKFLEYGIRRANYIIGQADYQNGLLYKYYHRRCNFVIPNYHPAPVKIPCKADQIQIVWIANMKEIKRPDLFIKLALEFIKRQDVKFLMIGRISQSGNLIRVLDLIEKTPNITCTGELPIEEVNEVLSSSHILVNTSSMEGFPNTFIQAWMRGVPVVSLNVDPDDIVKKNGLGFHSGSFFQMVKDVEVLISNPSLRNEMGERARQFALNKFSMVNLDKIIQIIQA